MPLQELATKVSQEAFIYILAMARTKLLSFALRARQTFQGSIRR